MLQRLSPPSLSSAASDSYSVGFFSQAGVNESTLESTGWPVIHHEVALLPGAQLCSCLILSQACSTNGRWHMCTSHTEIETHAHMQAWAHWNIHIKLREEENKKKNAGRVWLCLNISFSTAGGCWTCSDHQTSIKVSVCVMRPSSQGDQSAARPASSPPDGLHYEPRRTKSKHVGKRDEESKANRNKDSNSHEHCVLYHVVNIPESMIYGETNNSSLIIMNV